VEPAKDHKVSILKITTLVSKLLGPPEEVDLSARPGHAHRWMIFGSQRFNVYLHHSFNEDLALDLSPYAERLVSIGVVNSYRDSSDRSREPGADRATWMLLIAKSSRGHRELHKVECPSLGLPSTCAKH